MTLPLWNQTIQIKSILISEDSQAGMIHFRICGGSKIVQRLHLYWVEDNIIFSMQKCKEGKTKDVSILYFLMLEQAKLLCFLKMEWRIPHFCKLQIHQKQWVFTPDEWINVTWVHNSFCLHCLNGSHRDVTLDDTASFHMSSNTSKYLDFFYLFFSC